MSLIEAWKNKGKILEGIKNRIFRQSDVEEVYEERFAICKECPHMDVKGKECYVPGTQPCCSKCGCSLALKLRSLSSGCGDEENPRWDPILDDIEEELMEEQIELNND